MTVARESARDGRSARRTLLDDELARLASQMRGGVLEIGNGRDGRRGRFEPPVSGVERWVFVDRDQGRRPHVCADAMQLPFGASAFDTVVCLEMLEYVRQPDAAMREMTRVLRGGGTLILSVPFNTRPDAATDLWRFTANGLRDLARSAELDVAAVLPQGGVPAVVAQMLPHWTDAASWRRAVVLRLVASSGRVSPDDFSYTTGYVLVARKRAAAPEGA